MSLEFKLQLADEELSKTKANVHPLMIPHVLEKVFQYSNYNDLKIIRLVCPQWYNYSYQTFISRSRLHFRNFMDLNKFMEETSSMPESVVCTSDTETRHVTATLSTCLTPVLPIELCSHVRISSLEFQSWPSLLRPFLTKFSQYMKTLEIDHEKGSHSTSGMEDYFNELSNHSINLETIILVGSSLSYLGRENNVRFSMQLPSVKTLKIVLNSTTSPKNGFGFFRELFRALPNVENITCINYPFMSLYTLELIELPKTLNLVHMHVWNGLGLYDFISKNYPITTLILNVEVSMSLVNIHTMLQSLSASLQNLQLHFPAVEGHDVYNYSHNATSFPSAQFLVSLKYVKLVGFWGKLYFLQEIPRLEHVDIESMHWGIAFPDGIENENLFPSRIKKIVRFFDEKGIYHKL